MFCPNCGKTNSAEQKFCRSCGLRLDQIVESLTQQLKASDVSDDLVRRVRTLDRMINLVAVSTLCLVAGSVLFGIVYGVMIVKGNIVAGSILLSFMLGLITFGLLAFYRERLSRAATTHQKSVINSDAVDTARLLHEQQFESPPSVVERTTDLLSVERKQNS